VGRHELIYGIVPAWILDRVGGVARRTAGTSPQRTSCSGPALVAVLPVVEVLLLRHAAERLLVRGAPWG
jgi:hypothetical protein